MAPKPAKLINIRTGKAVRPPAPTLGANTMQVTNITDDTLGAYGQTFEPGQTRDLKDNDATRLVADNPRKFKLAPKHRNPKT